MIRRMVWGLIACLSLVVQAGAVTAGQAPAGDAAGQPRVYANMLQLMRGVLYPASNVIFTAQADDPTSFAPARRQSTSPDPFTGAYGGWEAVENSGLALAESANLLLIPRQCGNGKPAPVGNADWLMWVQQLRDAGMTAYKAGQAKDQDQIVLAAGDVSDACLRCHLKYRQVPGGFPNRC